MTPTRIQRQRTKGWRMPANTVYVGRGTPWGNPFKIGEHVRPHYHLKTSLIVADREHAVRLYLRFLPLELRIAAKLHLCGKTLACWCPLDQPCHAEVLLRITNRGKPHYLPFSDRNQWNPL